MEAIKNIIENINKGCILCTKEITADNNGYNVKKIILCKCCKEKLQTAKECLAIFEDKELQIKAEFFNNKKEKDFYLLNNCNVMAFGKIQDFDDDSKPFHLLIDFERDNSNIKVVSDLIRGETFEVFKGNVKWGIYSMDYYKKALKTLEAWNDCNNLNFYVSKEKDSPLLMANYEVGFVLAPRIEE